MLCWDVFLWLSAGNQTRPAGKSYTHRNELFFWLCVCSVCGTFWSGSRVVWFTQSYPVINEWKWVNLTYQLGFFIIHWQKSKDDPPSIVAGRSWSLHLIYYAMWGLDPCMKYIDQPSSNYIQWNRKGVQAWTKELHDMTANVDLFCWLAGNKRNTYGLQYAASFPAIRSAYVF